MTRCLNERAMIRLYFKEGTAGEHAHLRSCADCAEAYDRLAEDLEALHATLTHLPPPQAAAAGLAVWRRPWIPAAVALLGIAIFAGVMWHRPRVPLQVATETRSVTAFASDIATALFSAPGVYEVPDLNRSMPYLEAAFDVGQPCTGEAFFNGECSDQVSALWIATD